MRNETKSINNYWSCRLFIVSLTFSIAFAGANAIGYYCFEYNNRIPVSLLGAETTKIFSVVLIIVFLISYAAFYFVCQHDFYHSATEKKWSFKQLCILYSGFIFLCWTPYIILRYPGIVHLDTIEQIQEIFFPDKSWYHSMVPDYDSSIEHILLNHHPILTTMIFALFYKLGLLIGNVSAGLFIYTVIQAACLALSFGFCLAYLGECGTGKALTTVFCLFLAICPLNGINATIIVKDNLFFVCIVLLQIGLVELLRNEEAFLQNKKYCVLFGILMLFLSLTRHNGLYICVCVAVIFLFAYRNKGLLLKTCSCMAVVIIVIINSFFLPALGVTPGSSKEALSVPLQQMGRYVNEHLDEIDAEDRAVFEEGFSSDDTLETISEYYIPWSADGIKDRVKPVLSLDEKVDLCKLWIKWFFDDEECYIKATLNMVYPAFKTFSGENGANPDGTIITTKVVDWNNNDQKNRDLYHTEQDVGVHRENTKFFQISVAIDEMIIEKLMKTWGIRVLFQMDFYVWLMLAVLAVFIIKRQYKGIIVLSAVGINFLITLLGPIMYMRYFYPIVCCLPLLISYAFLLEVKKKKTDYEQLIEPEQNKYL